MDRNQRSRRQKSANGSYAQQSRRSMGSRLGLEKRNAPRPKAPPEKAAPTPHVPPRQRPAQEINPQKAGYRPGTPRRTRRITQAEIIRAKRRRRLLGALGVLAVLAVGAFVSINLLFKVTIFRVESYDGSQPVDTGIYTSDELIEALGIEKNSNLFAFSTAEKTSSWRFSSRIWSMSLWRSSCPPRSSSRSSPPRSGSPVCTPAGGWS